MGGGYSCNPCIEETESDSSIIEVEPYMDGFNNKTDSVSVINNSNSNNITTPGVSITKDKIKAIIKSNSSKNKKEQKSIADNTPNTTVTVVKEQILSEKENEDKKKMVIDNNNNIDNSSSLNKTNDISHHNNHNNRETDKEFLPASLSADNVQETKEQISEGNCFPPVDSAIKLQSELKDNNRNKDKETQTMNKEQYTTTVNNDKNMNNDDNKIVSLSSNKLFCKERVNALNNDDIVFYGTLRKMVNNVDRKCISYATRFCILTKECFFYFPTKESFMSLHKPLCQLPLEHISSVEGDNKEYFCLLFIINNITSPLLSQTNTFEAILDTKRNQKIGMLAFQCNNVIETKKWIAVIDYLLSTKPK